MRLLLISVVALAAGAVPGFAQEKPAVPQDLPPQFCLASAVEEKGRVTVYVSLLKTETRVRTEGGKQVVYQALVWMDGTPLVLGQTVRAYRPDGKPAGPMGVMKALSKPTATAFFVPHGNKSVAPDVFYLETLRAGTVALVFDIKDVMPPGTPER